MAEARGLRGLRNPAVIAGFGGWNDAGEAASGVIDHLVDQYKADLAFAVDPEEFYDFQVNRPTTRLIDGNRIIEWPTTEVLVASLPERDLVLIGGPEPNYRWQEYVESPAVDVADGEAGGSCAARCVAHRRPAHPSGAGHRDGQHESPRR